MSGVKIPLGISEEYDSLLVVGAELKIWCQGCEKYLLDRMRDHEGCKLVACFCCDCRSEGRMQLASPLPVCRVIRKG